MIILAVIAENERPGERRAKGRMVKEQWAVALDSYNVSLAYRSGENPWVGRHFFMKFDHMSRVLNELGIDTSNVAALVGQSLHQLFKNQQERMSFADLDKKYSISKSKGGVRGTDRTGIKQIYVEVKQALGIGGDDDEEETTPKKKGKPKIGDLIVPVDEFADKAFPQQGFRDEEVAEVEEDLVKA